MAALKIKLTLFEARQADIPDELYKKLYSFKNGLISYDTFAPVKPLQITAGDYLFLIVGNYTKKSIYSDRYFNEQWTIQSMSRLLEGCYCCMRINTVTFSIDLYTDYLGMYPMFLYQDSEQILISTEIKLIKAMVGKTLNWNQQASQSYLENGHLISNQSWYKEITKMRPASCYRIQASSMTIARSYYWTWADLDTCSLTGTELLKQYVQLFESGIKNLDFKSDAKLGVSLSGGLDSRWIAYLSNKYFDCSSFTFADSNNYELQLASRVANRLEMSHEWIKIDKQDWLRNRLPSFWKVDGLLHVGHLHEGPIYQLLKENYPIYFHGFFGGGIYAGHSEKNQWITEAIASKYFKLQGGNSFIDDAFYNTDSVDAYLIDQRIRNQSAHSIYLLSQFCQIVLPFYNMDWMKFNYSVDDQLQINCKLYLKALNYSIEPELLKIPWQRTGIAPSAIRLNELALKFRLPAIKEKLNQCFGLSRHFINYHSIDAELNGWMNKYSSELFEWTQGKIPSSREAKFRVLSLFLIQRMMEKNSENVL